MNGTEYGMTQDAPDMTDSDGSGVCDYVLTDLGRAALAADQDTDGGDWLGGQFTGGALLEYMRANPMPNRWGNGADEDEEETRDLETITDAQLAEPVEPPGFPVEFVGSIAIGSWVSVHNTPIQGIVVGLKADSVQVEYLDGNRSRVYRTEWFAIGEVFMTVQVYA